MGFDVETGGEPVVKTVHNVVGMQRDAMVKGACFAGFRDWHHDFSSSVVVQKMTL